MLSGLGLRIRLEIGGVRGPMQGPVRLGPELKPRLRLVVNHNHQEAGPGR